MAAVLVGLLVVPGLLHSQEANRDQKIAELEKQLADLQRKLDELKRSGTSKAPRPIALERSPRSMAADS